MSSKIQCGLSYESQNDILKLPPNETFDIYYLNKILPGTDWTINQIPHLLFFHNGAASKEIAFQLLTGADNWTKMHETVKDKPNQKLQLLGLCETHIVVTMVRKSPCPTENCTKLLVLGAD